MNAVEHLGLICAGIHDSAGLEHFSEFGLIDTLVGTSYLGIAGKWFHEKDKS